MPAWERLPSMLELKGICKRYVTQSFTRVALDSVSLSFRDNEFVALLSSFRQTAYVSGAENTVRMISALSSTLE